MSDRFAPVRAIYLSLGLGELASVATFALAANLVLAPLLAPGAERALWFALAPLLVVLLQAGAYWLAARSWVGHRPMPARFASVYRAFRILDPVLLAAGLGGAVASLPAEPAPVALVLFVWAFGVVEYLNYFVVRLSYPPRRWFALVGRWRTPVLVRDLDRSVTRRVEAPTA